MHALPLYLDTSVIGGYFAEFRADKRALWQLRDAGKFQFVSSTMRSTSQFVPWPGSTSS